MAAVALHARTAAQSYSGTADWAAIAAAQGGGHRRSRCSATATSGRPTTRCAMVRRDRLRRRRRRPRLPGPAVAVRRPRGRLRRRRPSGCGPRSARWPRRCAGTPCYSPSSTASEHKACRDIRKHIAWYLKGFPAGHHVRHQLALVESLAALDDLIATLDLSQPWPGEPAEGQRGRAGSPRRVALPEGWLDSQELNDAARAVVAQAELSVSGG